MAEIEARAARQPTDMARNFGPRAAWSAMQAASLGVAAYGPMAYVEWLAQLPRVTWSAYFLNASIFGTLQRLFGDDLPDRDLN